MKKKTIYSIIFYSIFWLFILYIRTDNFRDFAYNKGEFNDIIIENYNKEAAEEGFQQVSIVKYSGDDRMKKTSRSQIYIEEMLALFDDLHLVEDSERWNLEDTKYRISFDNINTPESVDIILFDESHLSVWITLVDKKIDEKNKIIHYDQDFIDYGYSIQDDSINLKKLEEVFNSIKNQ
ncbi:hypothetical protein SAMN02745751_00111 [Dethiosulfatibacter aminovorans DSM 17477]|uniref:Uncharacterized protein n=1 Tax=Dethiosulfatibacter aminovorans DSM 17477 TaxID=1121476 RepID=A0A1M6AG64_9FIRM|nr:hypothetical protein [Dethiosulfatibacter aminovorans]SHI35514.1 hypothetical protein SAMN02745751_00111 [Dethiosulfatibacter aminovorans DSM 17477]